jgi:hypothetical protein
VDPGAITLARPIDVLKPREVSLKRLGDFPNALRHAGVGVVSDKDESQAVTRAECGLLGRS